MIFMDMLAYSSNILIFKNLMFNFLILEFAYWCNGRQVGDLNQCQIGQIHNSIIIVSNCSNYSNYGFNVKSYSRQIKERGLGPNALRSPYVMTNLLTRKAKFVSSGIGH